MSTWSWSHLCEQQGGHQPSSISYEGDGGNFLRVTSQIAVPQTTVWVQQLEQLPPDGGMRSPSSATSKAPPLSPLPFHPG